jgi:hypothetical protein
MGAAPAVRPPALVVLIDLTQVPLRQLRPSHEAQLGNLARRNNPAESCRNSLPNSFLRWMSGTAVSTDSTVFRPFWPRSVQVVCRARGALRLPVEIFSSRDHTFSGAGSGHPVRSCLPPAGFYRPSSEASRRSVDGGASLCPAADVTGADWWNRVAHGGGADRSRLRTSP